MPILLPLNYHTPSSRTARPPLPSWLLFCTFVLPLCSLPAAAAVVYKATQEPFFGPIQLDEFVFFILFPAPLFLGWIIWTAGILRWLSTHHILRTRAAFLLLVLLIPILLAIPIAPCIAEYLSQVGTYPA